MKKVLFVATVVQKHINVFHLPYLKQFQERGYKTFVAAANDTDSPDVAIPFCDQYCEVRFKRNPFHPGNICAYLKLKRLIDQQDFDIIHCHTPVGGVLGRLAAIQARKRGSRVFYTAHGFHFYKGAPVLNWLIYYPIEKLCAHFTDVLITINQEDYALAKRKMKAKHIEYIPGVGIDMAKFEHIQIDKAAKRRQLSIPEDAFLLLSVGELNKNKNHQIIVKALAKLNHPHIHYAIAGVGNQQKPLQKLANKLNVAEKLHILGYRDDVPELNYSADVFCFPSKREGLSVSLMEAMACGLPVLCSQTRGNTDLINRSGGELFNADNVEECCAALAALTERNLSLLSKRNQNEVKKYSVHNVLDLMNTIYDRG